MVYDPLDFESLRDPYPLYRVLRDEFPVYHNAERGIWALTRFEDVQAASRDWETFATVPGVDLDDFVDVLGPGSIIDLDPPRHDELRDVVRRHFAPAAILRREAEMTALAEALLDELLEQEEADLAADFAWQLPVAVISMLLGFPAEDRQRLSMLAQEFAYRESGELRVPERTRAAARELREYFGELMSDRQRRPRNDVLSEIAAADRSARVSFEEAISICNLLFLAGIETTASLVSNTLHILAHEPEKAELLRQRPELMPRAVEEFLRYESPNQLGNRITTQPVQLGGIDLPAGTQITVCIGAANRDPGQFNAPDELDIGRSPNRHLAFASGIHQCVGMAVARLEAATAISALIRRFPRYSLASAPTRGGRVRFRGFLKIPCSLDG